ncbi:symmetrical bis(5'-nucleosyl)-tetraphosphatase [Pseudomaricurvus sp. HS19]|uniref:symmetrical bis(5'-nucleosyl)-tetraphosphatase n=1 Tax=Pseudomaricurvus sp. HS19 TaxID=2692626 RepID=UPI0013707F60|nr:symmetrical bis(5'-nucleosyl)-tetraphosphatase [Pseudomaricurvus sp. HS19]MYM64334.1 symmetrical bis(5'-nucleosyl)-tetraphosphatase [Pseudomaricurvus sp. HS19]
MATYAVGDLQGCLDPLQQLLRQVQFNEDRDQLWLLGDLINRGPQSLETLQYLYPRRDNVVAVLGNHDLHLLACAYGHRLPGKGDTLDAILATSDSQPWYQWLRHCPLVHHDPQLGFAMVHAGIPPGWSLEEALRHSAELESVLQGPKLDSYLGNMYGNQPDLWDESLEGPERWRLITNYFTRMRVCDAEGRLELKYKEGLESLPAGYAPWFRHPHRQTRHDRILFGHWAALQGVSNTPNVYALDSGCVWGGCLTMMRLEDEARFTCDC